MSEPKAKEPAVVAQPILAPLTRAAIFSVVCVKPDRESWAAVRSLCGDLQGIFRAVDFRRIEAALSCVVAFQLQRWRHRGAIRDYTSSCSRARAQARQADRSQSPASASDRGAV